ncbi:iron ABC transporter permease [Salipiger sp. IMCC34102]|uniref:FecCD family ABC transporter permease n=1 Tax=Salipiger sp. IMCC34102 TaxID=2510647 RepID=UPI00101D9EF5|nr:iron ABC transporter permease [Salipiger sp. IMCC34102]RYH04469.1 iron ABC transporter permease [Salipiger sp. IMCC34102]
MVDADSHLAGRLDGDRDAAAHRILWVLVGLLGLAALASLTQGASGTSLWSALAALMRGEAVDLRDRIVLVDIRLPRLAMGMIVGASLAVSGAVMQGLFRNPLADPGLVGVSAGAGLGAITAIVLGGMLPAWAASLTGDYLVAIAAFFGGWISTMLLYHVSTRAGRTSVATMLLAGIALGALSGAVSGLLVYAATDAQLRELTFWGLGSLAGATWQKLAVAGPIMVLALAATPMLARGLDGLALGETAAHHMGLPVQRVKSLAILTVAAAVGAAVAVSGGIGFVGIVVPHALRLAIGPGHRMLLPASALLGAVFLVLADLISRMAVAPAELPIGIVTAIVGGPVFLWLLLRLRGVVDL